MQLSGNAAVLWTGGKDCNLALYRARMAGYEIKALVTFIMGDGNFKAHPIKVMKLQAKALGLPYLTIPIAEPYKENYEAAIRKLKEEQGIDILVTGDIAEIHGNTNWITERSKPSGVKVFLPLWHLNREELLRQLFSLGFKVVLSCVKEPWFNETWLGRPLNEATLGELRSISNLDLCGEQGEYHTLVVDGPKYKYEIAIDSFTPKKEKEIMYMELHNPVLKPKQEHVST